MSLALWNFLPAPISNYVNLGNYDYVELDRTYQEQFGISNSTITRTLMVKYERRLAFIGDALGYATVNGGGDIERVLPDQIADNPTFYAMECGIETKGVPSVYPGGQTRSSATNAIVKIVYRSVDYPILADGDVTYEYERYTSRKITPTAEFISCQGGMAFVTVGPKKPLQFPIARMSPSTNITMTWQQVPGRPSDPFVIPNIEKIQACLGRVNNSVFDGKPVGTVLFVSAEATGPYNRGVFDQSRYWQINFNLIYKNNGIAATGEEAGPNYLFEQSSGAWDLPTNDGTLGGVRIYEEADLNQLWILDGV